MSYPLQELKTAFFEDPRWSGVENILEEFIAPLLDIRKIDTSKDADDVKAQIIGRIAAYDQVKSFLSQTKIVGSQKRAEIKNNPFR